jgi:hypothetical protein
MSESCSFGGINFNTSLLETFIFRQCHAQIANFVFMLARIRQHDSHLSAQSENGIS